MVQIQKRIAAVDAARGLAMTLVCLGHIKHHFVDSAPQLYWFLGQVTRIATPTFLLLSGFVIGYLLRNETRPGVRTMLVDRGLFLILIGHLVLGLEHIPDVGVMAWLFGRIEITDAVGVALFVAIAFRPASAFVLATVATIACIASWFIGSLAQPESALGGMIGSVLFNIGPATDLTHVPLVPYLGAFLIGMALSAAFMPAGKVIDGTVISRQLVRLAAAAIATVIAGIVAWHFGKSIVATVFGDGETMALWRATLNPANKHPPSPAYFLFYGGLGLLMLAAFFAGRPRGLMARLQAPAATIGRASFVCFVAQDWLLFTIPHALGYEHVTSVAFWLTYWAAVVLALYGLSRFWSAWNGNRFLTVGLRTFAKSTAAGPSPSSPRPGLPPSTAPAHSVSSGNPPATDRA